MNTASDIKARFIKRALENGFDVVRFTSPSSIPDAPQRLQHFLDSGYQGDMEWMLANSDRRGNPRILWEDVRSIIMLGVNYGPDYDPMAVLEERARGYVSVYARGKDYHDVIKKKLKQVAGWLHQETGDQVKVFVDTAPVMEKPLAEASGMGWQGKHTNLVSRSYGSWLFLSAIYTTADFEPDLKDQDHCGSCSKCLEICPTKAFPTPYQLDARRCIAYLTIEYKGHIANEFREAIGNRVFGCDDCLSVCPWNKYARLSSEARFLARTETDNPSLEELLVLSDSAFRERFRGTPVKRTGRDRFVRNVLIAAGNSGEKKLLRYVVELLEDSSPLVRAMAVWACKRLMTVSEFSELCHNKAHYENDEDVLIEWGVQD